MFITLEQIKKELDFIVETIYSDFKKDNDGNLLFTKATTQNLVNRLKFYDSNFDNEDDWVIDSGLRIIRIAKKDYQWIMDNGYTLSYELADRDWFLFMVELEATRTLLRVKISNPNTYCKLVSVTNTFPLIMNMGYFSTYDARNISFRVYPNSTFTMVAANHNMNFFIQDIDDEKSMRYLSLAIPDDKNTPLYALKIKDRQLIVELNKYSL